MAVIQYTAIVNQIRGKLNGSVFNKSRNAYTLQRKQVGKKSQTIAQLKRRAMFANVQRTWKLLTPTERSQAEASAMNNPTRDRFGNEVVLSGYNHWVKANLIITLIGRQIQRALTTTSAPPVPLEFESSITDFSILSNGLVGIGTGAILKTTTSSTPTIALLCYISFPMSQGVTNYNGRWLYVGSQVYNAGTMPVPELDVNFDNTEGVVYPLPNPAQRVLIRIDAWAIANGALVQRIETATSF